jgi:hypothetical protein
MPPDYLHNHRQFPELIRIDERSDIRGNSRRLAAGVAAPTRATLAMDAGPSDLIHRPRAAIALEADVELQTFDVRFEPEPDSAFSFVAADNSGVELI